MERNTTFTATLIARSLSLQHITPVNIAIRLTSTTIHIVIAAPQAIIQQVNSVHQQRAIMI